VSRRAAAAGALLALSACASPPPEPAPVAAAPPPSAVSPPARQSPVAGPARETCDSAELKTYIGRPRTDLPAPVWPDRERVACTTCPITQDYRPDRVNVFFDADTGIVKEVRCG
jgi:hypothetical protein